MRRTALLIPLLFLSQPLLAEDDTLTVLQEAKVRYAQFQKNVQDMVISQEMTMNNSHGETKHLTQVTLKGKKYRIEGDINLGLDTSAAEAPTTILFDGADSWVTSFFIEKRKMTALEAKKYYRDSYFWERILSAKPLRQELVGNYDCIVVETKDERGVPITIWIEKISFNIIKAELKSPHMLWWFWDSREIAGGWPVAHTHEIYAGSTLLATVRIKSIEINKNPSDDLFDAALLKPQEVAQF